MYLFDPHELKTTLSDYPTIAKKLGDPDAIGTKAVRCPGLRLSRREVIRLLTNKHYSHLADLIAALEELSARDLITDRIYRTGGLSQFRGDITEISIAYSLHRAGVHLTPLDIEKANSPVADFEIERNGRGACVEIFRPRMWEGVSLLEWEIQRAAKNLDYPASFIVDLDIKARAGAIVTATTLDEADAKLRSRAVREALVAELSDGLVKALEGAGPSSFILQGELPGAQVECGVRSALKSTGRPERLVGGLNHPKGGYAPEGVFARILNGGITNKLRAGQALQRPGVPGLLIVETSSMDLDWDWDFPFYFEKFQTQVASPDFDLRGHAAVVFVRAGGWGAPLEILLAKTAPGFQLDGLLN